MPSVADYADADAQELSAQAPTIILAEDSESAAKLVLSMLNALTNCKVVLVKDGDDAFQAVRENKGAILVIMDVHMAIKDGIDATREIRFWEGSKRGTGEHLPIVALTGSTSPDVEQECLAAGMDAFLRKPCKAQDLKHLLHKYHLGAASL